MIKALSPHNVAFLLSFLKEELVNFLLEDNSFHVVLVILTYSYHQSYLASFVLHVELRNSLMLLVTLHLVEKAQVDVELV